MEGPATSRSRRSVLRAVLVTAAGVTGRAWAQSMDNASSDKMTKARAEYQDTPNGIYSCATCTLFVPPSACKVVAGEVSPDGWCKAFALAD
jgi:hypothetical protein